MANPKQILHNLAPISQSDSACFNISPQSSVSERNQARIQQRAGDNRAIHSQDSLRPAPRWIWRILSRLLMRLWRTVDNCDFSTFWLLLWEEKRDQTCRRVQRFLEPLFSHGDPTDSLHNDSDSFTYCLCYLQGRHDLVHCGYESDHDTISYKLPGLDYCSFPIWFLGAGVSGVATGAAVSCIAATWQIRLDIGLCNWGLIWTETGQVKEWLRFVTR
jgi:hypothetical protein